jgi:hypothetical protein
MDSKTTEIRYQQWVQVIQDWHNSGLSKRGYCRAKGIDEKQFYYYQRRIRSLIAAQANPQLLPDGNSSMDPLSCAAGRPQIVKLQFPSMASSNSAMISFSVNGMNISVPENIPAPFLAKLLEAASNGSR